MVVSGIVLTLLSKLGKEARTLWGTLSCSDNSQATYMPIVGGNLVSQTPPFPARLQVCKTINGDVMKSILEINTS